MTTSRRIEQMLNEVEFGETFVVVVDDPARLLGKVVSVPYATQKEAVAYAKKIPGAWVESRGGRYDGEVAWQSR